MKPAPVKPAPIKPGLVKRWLPHPLMAAFLLLAWLVLRQSLAPGTIVVGTVIALGLAWVFGQLRPPPARVRHWPLLGRLLLRVAGDIVRSNLAVARIVLRPRRDGFRSGFVAIPLELTDPYGLATLACIITSTPGTIWVDHDSIRNVLLIHVLDLIDEDAWIATIKQRYERPLLEIFQ